MQSLGIKLGEVIEEASRALSELEDNGTIKVKDIQNYYIEESNRMFKFLQDNKVELSPNILNIILTSLCAYAELEKHTFAELSPEEITAYREERVRIVQRVSAALIG